MQQAGGRLLEATRQDVVYRPGRNAHLRFAAQVERAGTVRREGWVLCAGRAQTAGEPVADEAPGGVTAWRVRDDPVLTGLRAALDVGAVAGLLGDLGVPPDGVRLELLAYRPERRAVVVATTPTHRLFLKCVPPDKADALHRRHTACRAAGVPVPRAVGYDAALGLLVLTPLHGEPLRSALMAPGVALPPVEEVAQLQEQFAAAELDLPARSMLRQVRGHAALLREVLPSEQGRVDDLVDRIDPRRRDARPPVVIHGDLYDDQLLVRDGRVAGVVDVDGAGLGDPADDAGNLLAHLLVLRLVTDEHAGVHAWLPALRDELRRRHDPAEVGRRTAAVLVGLATWPHSRQAPQWQDQTRDILALAESALAGQL